MLGAYLLFLYWSVSDFLLAFFSLEAGFCISWFSRLRPDEMSCWQRGQYTPLAMGFPHFWHSKFITIQCQ